MIMRVASRWTVRNLAVPLLMAIVGVVVGLMDQAGEADAATYQMLIFNISVPGRDALRTEISEALSGDGMISKREARVMATGDTLMVWPGVRDSGMSKGEARAQLSAVIATSGRQNEAH